MSGVHAVGIAAILAVFLSNCPSGFGHFTEVEPNQSCAEAQILDANLDFLPIEVFPIEVPGELAHDPDIHPSGDVDFFRIRAEPGTLLQADLIAGESTVWPFYSDPVLGLFDDECNLVERNDNYYTVDARIEFTVPEGGEFVLGVSSFPDFEFTGAYFPAFYTLRLDQPPEPIGGIIGRVVDADTGEAVVPEAGSVQFMLFRVMDRGSEETLVRSQPSDSADGTFRIEMGDLGPLDPGQYRLNIDAWGYEQASSGPYDVNSGEVVDLGTIELIRTKLTLAWDIPCYDFSSATPVCSYSVVFYNTTDSAMTLRVWSIVEGLGEGFGADVITEFPALPRFRTGVLEPRSYGYWQFTFRAPETWPDDVKYLCPKAWASDNEFKFLGVLRSGGRFCLTREGVLAEP